MVVFVISSVKRGQHCVILLNGVRPIYRMASRLMIAERTGCFGLKLVFNLSAVSFNEIIAWITHATI